MTENVTRSTPGGKKIRDRQRLAHLVTGMMLIAYVYLPGGPSPVLQAATRWVIMPVLVIAGMLMWQWPRIRRWTHARAGRS